MELQGNTELAKKIAASPRSCIKKVKKQITVLVHPMYSVEWKKGVFIELNALFKRYSKVLGGIAVAYENVQRVSSHGWLFDTNPFNHITVSAEFYVFAPEIGSVLEGVVQKKTVNHISCLVHGMFNVSVSKPLETSVNSWCGTYVEEGDGVKLTVTYLCVANFMPYIKGELDPECVQELINLRSQREADVAMGDTPKQNTRIILDDDSGISSNELDESLVRSDKEKNLTKSPIIISQALEDDIAIGEVKSVEKVKSKKRKRSEENLNDIEIEDMNDVKHKKRKRKDDEVENIDLTDKIKDRLHKKIENRQSMDGYMNESSDLEVSVEGNHANDDDVDKPSVSEVNDGNLKKRKSKNPSLLNNNKETEFRIHNSIGEVKGMEKVKGKKRKRSVENLNDSQIEDVDNVKHKKKKRRKKDNEVENSDLIDKIKDSIHKKIENRKSMDGYMNESLDLNVSVERNRVNDDVNKPSVSEVNDSNPKKRKSKSPFLSNNKETEFIKYPSPRRTSEENVNQLKSGRKSSPSEFAESRQIPINEVSPSRKSKESNSQNENKELLAFSTLTPKRSRKSLSRKRSHLSKSELEIFAGLPDITFDAK